MVATTEDPILTSDKKSLPQRFREDITIGFRKLDLLAGQLGFRRDDNSGIAYGNFLEFLNSYRNAVLTGAYPIPKKNKNIERSINRLADASPEQRREALKQVLSSTDSEERALLLKSLLADMSDEEKSTLFA